MARDRRGRLLTADDQSPVPDDDFLIDLSPPVGPGSPVWPGDVAFARHTHWPMTDGSPVEVSSMTTTGHVGAHADAPAHVLAGGSRIGELDLAPYLGECRVVDCRGATGPLGLDHVRDALAGARTTRLLVRRYDRFPTGWVADFPGVAPEVLAWFAGQGGRLVGVDTASLDPMTSTTMAAHRAAFGHGLAVLENLDLTAAEPGPYELVALPLRLTTMDASPVRAVLRRPRRDHR